MPGSAPCVPRPSVPATLAAGLVPLCPADRPHQQYGSARESPPPTSPAPRPAARVSVAAACFDGGATYHHRTLPPPRGGADVGKQDSREQKKEAELTDRLRAWPAPAPAMKD
ncbi:hypothetical protein HPB50_021056 [Hyalomma asiaticum]|uniref:Uncharacterized protein n=1 Tax=Hyalomma asiaticum TaxID=266040 RepID=A0ACB7SG39_HYAAI|nr:hypothetical protein HPB50_021056 [Hyalomma asiaticum]